ncbi:peptidoglycan-binding protein [Streptomyces sp. LN785]|uniref:peptidoglycan-binding protein n=1 Tax=Streptomyces sp. LN785 TaxID=3112983 RepID=UPI003714197D
MASALTRRRRLALSAAAGAALLSIGGVLGSMAIKSPAQAMADSKAPKASVITAPVEKRRMVKSIVFRGDFGTGRQTEITPTGSPAAGGSSGEGSGGGASRLVVTKVLAKPGDEAASARPLAEVSGRPVFVLPGKVPSYRDLVPGSSGEDIAQLQDALADLGHSRGGDARGHFGAGTKRAVAALYRRMGYAAPVTGERTREAVTQARTTLEEKQQQVDRLASGATGEQQPTPSGSPVAPSQTEPDGAAGSLRLATKALAEARKAYDRAVAGDGAMVPMSEAVFVSRLPARITSLPLAVGEQVEGPVAVLTSGSPQLTGYLDPDLKERVAAGMRVEVTAESLGTTMTGTIRSIGAKVTPGDTSNQEKESGAQSQPREDTSTVNGGVPFLPVSVSPSKAWNENLAGQNVMIKISSALTDSEVLAVPQAAMLTGADARATVTVLAADGSERRVVVIAGVSADGMVQITPAAGERVKAGDRVVIGQ